MKLRNVRWGDYPGLSWWAHCNHQHLYTKKVREERCGIADLEYEGRDHKSKMGGRL